MTREKVMFTLLTKVNCEVEVEYKKFGKTEKATGKFRHMNDGGYIWLDCERNTYKQIKLDWIVEVK